MAGVGDLRRLALALPAVEEGTAYGTPAWRVRGKLFARLREEGLLMVRCEMGERELLLRSEPDVFTLTPHYAEYPAVLVRLERIPVDELAEVLEEAWRLRAPKRLVAARDAEREPG